MAAVVAVLRKLLRDFPLALSAVADAVDRTTPMTIANTSKRVIGHRPRTSVQRSRHEQLTPSGGGGGSG